MNIRIVAREEKIIKHCNALAEIIISSRDIYNKSEKQQQAFIETMVGAAIWYIPKPTNAWTGYISVQALKAFHPESNVLKPKLSEEHVYPRKVAARLLLENKDLNGKLLHQLFNEQFGRLHYITPDENKAVIQFQKDAIFNLPEEAYKLAKIDLIKVERKDLKNIKKRDVHTIKKYI